MRILSGKFKNKALAFPTGAKVRPTSAMVRGAIFDILHHTIFIDDDRDPWQNKHVLDLFAGSGALGFEALSRGCEKAIFVENDPKARGTIRENAQHLGLSAACRIWRRSATDMGRCAPMKPADLIFCDPPYHINKAYLSLDSCVKGGWLAPNSAIVVEVGTKEPTDPQDFCDLGLEFITQRTWDDTSVLFFRTQ